MLFSNDTLLPVIMFLTIESVSKNEMYCNNLGANFTIKSPETLLTTCKMERSQLWKLAKQRTDDQNGHIVNLCPI